MNGPQKKAVESAPERPLLIVAGAGTGKTATLTARVARFIKEGVPPGNILSITFTNKAAREMAERIYKETGLGKGHGTAARPLIGTFHSFGARILRENARAFGRTPDFVIYDDHDSFALVKRTMKALDLKKEAPSAYARAISAYKNNGTEPDKSSQRDVLAEYEEALRRANAFDFDDLISKTVLLFRENPDVLGKYRSRYTHILVDEYQDLNDIQYELLRLLAAPRENKSGASFSVVGDAEQTIYGWRGSNIEIFLRFPEEWSNSEIVTLTQNYRSTKNILLAAGGVIRENSYDTKVKRATDLWTENREGDLVVVRESANEEEEAHWIAGVIASEPGPGTAILYRTNAQSRALEQALLLRRIPYVVFGGLKFYERREVKDIVAGLRLALSAADEVARDRMEKAFGKRGAKALEAALRDSGSIKPLDIIDIFLRSTDYFSYIEKNMSNPRDRKENIEELIRFAGGFAELPPLLEEIALLQSTDSLSGADASRAVNLMTIHLAKGLEFDRVFAAGVSEGILPHARSMNSEPQMQEERRLMYVAMTRARHALYLSFYGIPSRFLGEIPPEAVQFIGAPGSRAENFGDEEYEEKYISLE